MERNYIATGKTIDLAIQAALDALRMDRDSVSVEVLENAKTGFLGIGASPAKVKVTYEVPDEVKMPSAALSSASRSKPRKEVKSTPAPAKVVDLPKPTAPRAAASKITVPKNDAPKPEPKAEQKSASQPEKMEEFRQQQSRSNDRHRNNGGNKNQNRSKAPKQEQKPQTEEQSAQGKPAPKEYAPVESGSTEERIEIFITGLLRHMGSEAVPHASKTSDDTYYVELVGENLGMLIGRRGDTLDAIQHLTNYTINRDASKRSRINVDAESYRAKREESLRRLAKKVAGKVVRYRRNITLEPMNAYERHVIHATLQDVEGVSTFSTGAEPNRRVVVSYNRYKNSDVQKQ